MIEKILASGRLELMTARSVGQPLSYRDSRVIIRQLAKKLQYQLCLSFAFYADSKRAISGGLQTINCRAA